MQDHEECQIINFTVLAIKFDQLAQWTGPRLVNLPSSKSLVANLHEQLMSQRIL